MANAKYGVSQTISRVGGTTLFTKDPVNVKLDGTIQRRKPCYNMQGLFECSDGQIATGKGKKGGILASWCFIGIGNSPCSFASCLNMQVPLVHQILEFPLTQILIIMKLPVFAL